MTGGIALVAAVLLLGDNSPFATVLDRLASASSLSDLTTGRSDVFSAYLSAITENVWTLLFGSGLAASNLGRDPHNLYIEIAYYLGIVGLGLIIAYYCTLIHAINYRNKTRGRQNLIAKYLPLLVVALFHMTLHGMTTFPAYMAFFVAALSMLVITKPEEVAPCQD
jgi:O-antigen ligase